MAAVHGVARWGAAGQGIIRTFGTTDQVDEATYADANGDVAATTLFNRNEEATARLTYDAADLPPDAGDTLTVNSNNYNVMSVGDEEDQGDYRQVTITLKRYVTNTIPA